MNKEFKNTFLLITYAIVLSVLLMNFNTVLNVLGNLGNILMPFIIGIIIAFILNVIVNMFENGILKKMKKGKRILSVIFSLLIVFGFVIILLFILIPEVKTAGEIFIENLPEYRENLYEVGEKLGLAEEQLKFLDISSDDITKELTNIITNNSEHLINASFGFANSIVSAVCNFFVGLVFAIYVLFDKENLVRQFKKLLDRLLPKKKYEKTLEVFSLSNRTFANFVKVQFVEACILGILCFIGMLIFGFPYATTISVLVGFTALIPVFGAFIGCVVGAFLIFMVSPIEALIFIAFFLILQQIEGNLIYPKVVGGKIGLPSIWVLVGVTVGGSVGGVFGMLIGVPIFSVIYALLKQYVNTKKSLKETIKETILDTIN